MALSGQFRDGGGCRYGADPGLYEDRRRADWPIGTTAHSEAADIGTGW